MSYKKTLFFLFVFTIWIMAADNDWPNLYGPGYSNLSNTTVLKPPLKLKWVTRVFDNFKSGPVVAEGKLVCMGRTGNLYCLDAETGEILWRYSIKRNFIPGNTLGSYSYGVRQAPCIWQGKVYANLFWSGYPEVSGMHCFDLNTGDLLWRKSAGYASQRSSASVVGGRVVLLSNCNVATGAPAVYKPEVRAWDAVTGDSLWSFAMGETAVDLVWQIAVRDTIYALAAMEDARGRTVALDMNGELIWQDSLHSFGAASLSHFQGRIYINTGSSVSILNSANGAFIRSDASPGYTPAFMGDRYWKRTYGSSPRGYNLNTGVKELTCAYTNSVTGCGNPTAANGYIYNGHGNTSGLTHTNLGHVLRAFDAVTGAVAWNFRMSSNACTTPSIAYDRLYYTAGGDGDLVYCFENAE